MPPWVYIVPEHVWSQYDGQSLKDIRAVSGMNPVVSGPFMLTGWEHGQGFTMDRNPNFWGPEPTVDRVDYRVYTNQEAMIQALKNNEIDIADGLKPSLINSVSNALEHHGPEGRVGLVVEPRVQLRRAERQRAPVGRRCTI